MARQARQTENPGQIVTDEDTPGLPELVETAGQIAAADAVIMDAAEVLKQVGRIEGLQFLATVADRVIAETYINIKESKRYKGLPYIDASGKPATVATIQEFCEAFMPRGYRRCEQLAENLHTLGPDLYDQAEAIGFRQRDYNALKALPADEQAIVRQAIESGKFDNAIELMQDMAVKHVKEKEVLQKDVAGWKADYEALDRVDQQNRERISRLEREAAKENPLHDWPEQIDGLKDDLHALGKVMDEVLSKHLTLVEATEVVYQKMDEGDPAHEQYKGVVFRMGEQIERLCTLAAGLRNQYELKLSGYVAMDKTHIIPDEA